MGAASGVGAAGIFATCVVVSTAGRLTAACRLSATGGFETSSGTPRSRSTCRTTSAAALDNEVGRARVARTKEAPAAGAPEYPCAGRTWQIISNDAARRRSDHDFQVRIRVDVADCRGTEGPVPSIVEGIREVDRLELLAARVENEQLSHSIAVVLGPRREDDLCRAVAFDIDDDRFAGEVDSLSGDDERPASMGSAVEPDRVKLAVIGRIEDLLMAIVVEISDDRTGNAVLDDLVVFGLRSGARFRDRKRLPVVPAPAPARAVDVEDERRMIEVALGVADRAVVDVAHDDELVGAVAIDVCDDRSTVGEVGSVLHTTIGVALEIRGLVDVYADLAPDLASSVELTDRALLSVWVEDRDVVGVRRSVDLRLAILVQIPEGDVLIVHAPSVAGVVCVACRKTRANGAVWFVDAHLLHISAAGSPDDDLDAAGPIEISERQGSHLPITEGMPRPELGAVCVVDRQLIAAPTDDHLERAIPREIGYCRAWPDAAAVRAPPDLIAAGALEHHEVVASPNDLGVSVIIEVDDRGRSVPPGVAVAALATP